MKKSEKQALQAQSVEQLRDSLDQARRELFGVRLKKATEPHKDQNLCAKLRRTVACIATILRQKELAQ